MQWLNVESLKEDAGDWSSSCPVLEQQLLLQGLQQTEQYCASGFSRGKKNY